jgi:hypothetical protein
MSHRTRFGRSIVLACVVLAGCADTDVDVGGTVMEVVFPGGTTGDFEIGQVTVAVQCTGQVNTGLPQNAQPEDGTSFVMALELENVGQDGQEVWASIGDVLGDCTFTISAFEPDGEQFCSGQSSTTVDPGDIDEVSVTLYCDASQNILPGTVDLDATTVVAVGNFCPFFNLLELTPDDFQNSPGATTEAYVCASDMADENPPAVVTSCGSRCDGPDLNRLTITCSAEQTDAGGNVIGPSTGTFSDPGDQDGDGIPETTDGVCDANPPSPTMSFNCDQVNELGARIRITCCGGDGDIDCNKCETHNLLCPPCSQVAKLLANDAAAQDFFGDSVAVAGDTAVIGAPDDDDNGPSSGSAYVFMRDGSGVWSFSTKLTASDAAAGDFFGDAVTISGNTIIIGAPGDDSSTGAAYVFMRSATVWSERDKLTASDGALNDNFGSAVALQGATEAVIGARGDDSSTGAAYVFERLANVWSQQYKLTASDGAPGDGFAASMALAIANNTIVIGAPGDDSSTGAAYVFGWTGTAWSQQDKLTASDGAPNDNFGSATTLADSSTAFVGAPGDNWSTGAVYVFARSANVWSEQDKLTAIDGAADDGFGHSVSVSGGRAAIGSFGDDDNGSSSGSAYVYARSGMTWSVRQKLSASDGASGDLFGGVVAIWNGDVIVGAASQDSTGSDSGSVYAFSCL